LQLALRQTETQVTHIGSFPGLGEKQTHVNCAKVDLAGAASAPAITLQPAHKLIVTSHKINCHEACEKNDQGEAASWQECGEFQMVVVAPFEIAEKTRILPKSYTKQTVIPIPKGFNLLYLKTKQLLTCVAA